MTKRPSLFGGKSPSAPPEPNGRSAPDRGKAAQDRANVAASPTIMQEMISSPRYPKAATREGKRVVTAYLDPEAFRQLKRIAADEDAQQQDLLVEGINLLFEKRGLSRIA